MVKLTIREIPQVAGLPFGHTLIGLYFGTCNYPSMTVMVSKGFLEAMQKGCEFQIGEPISQEPHLDGNAYRS